MKAVLFVDDHEVLARMSCEILEMQGYRAITAFNAEEALAKFDPKSIDIVVTDFRLTGMSGVELARRLREKSPATPVIMVSGYGPVDGGNAVDVCLTKTNLFPALLDKIKLLLAARNSAPGAGA